MSFVRTREYLLKISREAGSGVEEACGRGRGGDGEGERDDDDGDGGGVGERGQVVSSSMRRVRRYCERQSEPRSRMKSPISRQYTPTTNNTGREKRTRLPPCHNLGTRHLLHKLPDLLVPSVRRHNRGMHFIIQLQSFAGRCRSSRNPFLLVCAREGVFLPGRQRSEKPCEEALVRGGEEEGAEVGVGDFGGGEEVLEGRSGLGHGGDGGGERDGGGEGFGWWGEDGVVKVEGVDEGYSLVWVWA